MYFVYRLYQLPGDCAFGEVSHPHHYANRKFVTSKPTQVVSGLRKSESLWIVPGTLTPEQA